MRGNYPHASYKKTLVKPILFRHFHKNSEFFVAYGTALFTRSRRAGACQFARLGLQWLALLLAAVGAVGGRVVARRPVRIADLPPVKPRLRISPLPLTLGGRLEVSLVRSTLRLPQRCQGGRRKGNDQGYGKKKFIDDDSPRVAGLRMNLDSVFSYLRHGRLLLGWSVRHEGDSIGAGFIPA